MSVADKDTTDYLDKLNSKLFETWKLAPEVSRFSHNHYLHLIIVIKTDCDKILITISILNRYIEVFNHFAVLYF